MRRYLPTSSQNTKVKICSEVVSLISQDGKRQMQNYPEIVISREMLSEAQRLVPQAKVNRTVASPIDTLVGHLGEFVFAAYFFGDWRRHRVGKNRGEVDFEDVEIKTSAHPFSTNLHLLVRQDYAQKRKPATYVQIIIDIPSQHTEAIAQGTTAILCGFADADSVDCAPLKDFGAKPNHESGYQCHYIPIEQLRPMTQLRAYLRTFRMRRETAAYLKNLSARNAAGKMKVWRG
jgi:hypothetical protein